MFVTEKRAELVQLFNEVCPHAYSKWQASKYFLSHYRPQVIITLPENNDEMNNDYLNLAQSLIDEKIGEVEDGLKNSLRAHTELRANRLYFWFWNKVTKKSEAKKEINLVRVSLANETWSTFAQEAFDYIGTIIGVLRGRWLTKYNEDGTVLNTKSRDAFMSQDILKDHKRFFHLQRNATKYCHNSIKAVKAIENKWNVEIHIHGQDYPDTDCFSENGTRYYFQYHLDDKTEYIETCAYYSFWTAQFRNLHQERVYNSSLYPVGDPNVTPHSPLQDYVRYKHYDSDGWYEWEKAYDVDNSSYNEFYRLLCNYFFLYQEEIKANRKPWPKEFDYPTEPYRSKGYQPEEEWDDDEWNYTEEEYEEEFNDYYEYEEDVKYFDASSIQSIHNISWKELSLEGIY